jgi:hypothetical protein
MDLPATLKGPWNPLGITGTPMPPSLLLMCKILAVAALATGHFTILPDPFLPFIPGLDQLLPPVVFQGTLQTVFVLAALALLFNRSVRASALVLGSCFLLAVVSSKAYYGNNKTFCGLVLVLAGLSDFDRPPYLFRWQLSLVYFGAALNKLIDPDWQSGLFFEYWASAKVKNPVYLYIAPLLPTLVAGQIMCWGTIVAEFAVSFGLFFASLVPWALWINILFQVGLLEFTGNTFTLFFYGMTAVTLAFVTWPSDATHIAEENYPQFTRLQRVLLFSPGVWLGLTALLAALEGGPKLLASLERLLDLTLMPSGVPGIIPLVRRVLVAAVVVFFLPIYRWPSGTRR